MTPETPEALETHLPSLEFLSLFVPWRGWLDTVKTYVPYLTLVYDLDKKWILGAFTLELTKKTAELHGVCRLDLRELYPRQQADSVMADWWKRVSEDIFTRQGKEKVILKVPKESKGGRGFARRNGFRFINREKSSIVYRLKREDWKRWKES